MGRNRNENVQRPTSNVHRRTKMSNREPSTELLRPRDVFAWLPRLSRKTLEAMEAMAEAEGKQISSRPTGRCRYYLKTPLKQRLGMQ